jgi:HAD superfamily hydrolase (TIGR01509 family)
VYIAALFDMDGLLIDSEASIMGAWMRVADHMGVKLQREEYLTVVGRAAPDAIAVLVNLFGGKQRLELAHARVVADLDAIPAEQRFPLKAGTMEVLAALSELRIPCAVASSSARDEIEARLASAGVRTFFAALAGGDEVSRGKPDPEVYVLAARRLGVDPKLCVAFEDSTNGARAALAAGAKLVLVPDLVRPNDEICDQALKVLRSLTEAKPQLQSWFSPSRDA